MTALLRNCLSLWFFRPEKSSFNYRSSISIYIVFSQVAGLIAFNMTTVSVPIISLAMGAGFIPALLFRLTTIPRLPPGEQRIFIQRTMFASSYAFWPTVLAYIIGIDSLLLAVIATHGAICLWRFTPVVTTSQDGGHTTREANAQEAQDTQRAHRAQLLRNLQADPGGLLIEMGPSIGNYRDHEIPAWVLNARGDRFEYVCALSNAQMIELENGQQLIAPGLLYELKTSPSND